MSIRHRVPFILEPYLQVQPQGALILLTGTLECNVNWLTARFVSSALTNTANGDEPDEGPCVLLVSWLRDGAFWRAEVKRTSGLDTGKAAGRFRFLDALADPAVWVATTTGTGKGVSALEKRILDIIDSLRGRQVVLVLDNPDALLATNVTTAHELRLSVLRMRSAVHSAIIAVAADRPFMAAATQMTDRLPLPLEIETAAFVTQQAHAARFIISVRPLDSGAARDVSGVLRVTRGALHDQGADGETYGETSRELEALYLVQRDGSAQVFERGSDRID